MKHIRKTETLQEELNQIIEVVTRTRKVERAERDTLTS